MTWFVYMALCADKSIYTGITTNVQRRFNEHKKGTGAKYTRAKQIIKIIYKEEHPDRGSALRREMEIKKWGREKKLKLANSR
ncbi:MAG: putative endonuclease [Parcubacteria group bacterium Gr01-1014_19]|nr:MAG: putative endonuclease [Parcubacteria group bacterium Gr01-1014_19]